VEEKEIKLKKYTIKIYMNWIRYFCPCFFLKIDDDDDELNSSVHSDESTNKQYSFQENPMLRSKLMERN
jgi:hypothetical protein